MNFEEGFWGFIIGFFSGLFANWVFKSWENHSRGDKQFILKKIEGGLIKFEGQIPNSPTSQAAMNKVEKNLFYQGRTDSTSSS